MTNKATKKILSPGAIAWNKFKKNIPGMVSALFIIFCSLVAVFAYYIIPDKTPNANQQLLELSTQKPGFEVDMLRVPKSNVEKRNWFQTLLYGQPAFFTSIPFDSIIITRDETLVYFFNPEPCINPRTQIISNKELSQGKEFLTREAAAEYIKSNNVKHQKFLLGTDQFGRDFLSRLVLGSRVSLSVGFIAVFLSLVIGMFIGSVGGFFRGRIDDISVWFTNVVWSVPTLLMVIAITFALGKGFTQVFIAVGLTMWVEVARVVRGQIFSIREITYVEACKTLGYRNSRTIIKHIIPNILNPIIVISAANFATAILLEAGLSFLGIGVQPPMPSWGSMIKENYAFIILDAAYTAILPGICIMLLVLAFMQVGNALREALEVKDSYEL